LVDECCGSGREEAEAIGEAGSGEAGGQEVGAFAEVDPAFGVDRHDHGRVQQPRRRHGVLDGQRQRCAVK
jgi:hypothetical protein